METGLRSDENGAVIPRKIINRFVCTYAGTVVFSVDLHEAVSANPFFEFFLVATETGRSGIHLGRRRRQRIFVVTRSGGQLRPQAEPGKLWVRRGIAWGNRCSVELLIAAGLSSARRCGPSRPRATIRAFRSQPPAHRVMARPEASRAIPSVAGIDEQTIIRAMQAFRASEAPSHVMHAVALSLTDEELASVAHYLATHGEKASSP